MRFPTIILSMSLLVGSSLSFAENGAELEADKLLSTMGMEKSMQATITQMVDIQLQQSPTMAPYKEVMLEFFQKYMSYESVKPEMISLYAQVFSEAELKELNAFYQTPTGQKTIQKMPELMAKGAEIGISKVDSNIEEFQAMIAAEAERLQSLQAP